MLWLSNKSLPNILFNGREWSANCIQAGDKESLNQECKVKTLIINSVILRHDVASPYFIWDGRSRPRLSGLEKLLEASGRGMTPF